MKTIVIGLLALLIGGSAAQAFTSGPPKPRPANFQPDVRNSMTPSARQKLMNARSYGGTGVNSPGGSSYSGRDG